MNQIAVNLRRRSHEVAVLLASCAAVSLGTILLLGWLFDLSPWQPSSVQSSLVLPVVSGFLFLSGIGLPWFNHSTSARLRRFLPVVLSVPLLLSLVVQGGERWELIPHHSTLAVYSMLMCLMLAVVLWWAARSVDDADARSQIAQNSEREFRMLSDFDPLTGLLNRRSFLTRCEQECLRAQREGHHLACIMLDIDYFKKINDTHGHSAGDTALRKLAQICCEESRPEDQVCRYGGEEFCILLPGTNEADAVAAAQRIRLRIAATELVVADRRLRLSGSFGVAEFRDGAMGAQAIIDRADEALLVAKQTGRDRVVAVSSLDDTRFPDERRFTRPLAALLARDIMVPVALSLKISDSVRRASLCLLQMRLESIPVIDAQGKLAGLVSDQDVMAAMITPESSSMSVFEVMHRTVVCFDETATAEEIFRFLCRVAVPRVVVIQDGCPVGVLSRTIILRWLYNAVAGTDDIPPGPERDFTDVTHRSGLDRAIEELTHSAWRLTNLDSRPQDEIAACVIGEATRMQELVEHLLSLCQRADGLRSAEHTTVAGARSFL